MPPRHSRPWPENSGYGQPATWRNVLPSAVSSRIRWSSTSASHTSPRDSSGAPFYHRARSRQVAISLTCNTTSVAWPKVADLRQRQARLSMSGVPSGVLLCRPITAWTFVSGPTGRGKRRADQSQRDPWRTLRGVALLRRKLNWYGQNRPGYQLPSCQLP